MLLQSLLRVVLQPIAQLPVKHLVLDGFFGTYANLAFFMVNLSAILRPTYRQHHPDFSVLGLKSHFRIHRYLRDVIKSLPSSPASDFISRLGQRLAARGGICPPSHFQDSA